MKSHIPKKVSRKTGRKNSKREKKNKIIIEAVAVNRNKRASMRKIKPAEYFKVM